MSEIFWPIHGTSFNQTRWALSLDLGVVVMQSSTALCAHTADCIESASAISPSASAPCLLKIHGLRSARVIDHSNAAAGACTGLEALCDTSRSSKMVPTCTSMFTSTYSSSLF